MKWWTSKTHPGGFTYCHSYKYTKQKQMNIEEPEFVDNDYIGKA